MPSRGGTLTAEEPAEEPVEEPVEEVAEESLAVEEAAVEEPAQEEAADAEEISAVQAVGDGAAAVLSEEEGRSNTCGENLTWTYESGKLTISGTGAMTDYSSARAVPWYSSSPYITAIEIGSGVTSIGSYAFRSCVKITEIALPGSLTKIGSSAFYGCTGLTQIVLPGSLTEIGGNAFNTCTKITSIVVPDGVTEIGQGAFAGCTALKEVKLPDSLTTISKQLFYNCTALESAEIGNNVTTIAMQAFSSCMALKSITISDSVETIGASAFSGCNALESVVIGNGVKSIKGAFSSLTALKSITLGSSVASVEASAFSYSSYLTTITVSADNQTFYSSGNCLINKNTGALVLGGANAAIPNDGSVKTIGKNAFEGRTGLGSITIPERVTSIGDYAFSNCTGLTEITLPASLTSIGGGAFTGCSNLKKVNITDLAAWCAVSISTTHPVATGPLYLGAKLYLNGEEITTLDIPEVVTKIGAYVFLNCSGITSITIPNSVTSIGRDVFKGCTSLASLKTPIIGDMSSIYTNNGYLGYMFGASSYSKNSTTVPTTLTSVTVTGQIIGNNAFYGCTGLTSVIMTDSVVSIGNYAFYDCLGLESIEIGKNVTSIGSYAFYDCTKLREVIVPDSVTEIGSSAFESCLSLEKVSIGDLAAWCGIAFTDSFSNPLCTIGDKQRLLYVNGVPATDITIPATVTEIGPYAFYGYEKLTHVTLPASVTSISPTAFQNTGCYNDSANWSDGAFYIGTALISADGEVTGCTVRAGTTLIADAAFSNCTSLASVTLPESLTEIGSGAFKGCTVLSAIAIPAAVRYIGENAFSGCTALTSISLPGGLTGIGQKAFYNTGYYNDNANWENCALYIGSNLIEANTSEGVYASYSIKDGTALIADYAFSACTTLEMISIPASLTKIGNGAFSKTKKLTVTYAGTKAQWAAVQIGYDNGMLYSGTVTCSDGNAAMTITNSGSCGARVYWTLDSSKTLTIYGTGPMAGYGKESGLSPFADLSFTTVVVQDGVTTIGEHAFASKSIETLSIPKSVTVIGQGAFYEGVITSVSYAGTQTQWNNIIINNYNDALELANIVCEDTGASVGISISGATVAIGKEPGGTWVVKVTLGGNTLTSGTDYTFVVVSNGSRTSVTVTGCGDYSGTAAQDLLCNPGKVTGGEDEADILDVLALLKSVAGIESKIVYGDVNNDGVTTILDVLALLKYVAGIEGSVVY